jgi:UDP-glucose 4-epimerase
MFGGGDPRRRRTSDSPEHRQQVYPINAMGISKSDGEGRHRQGAGSSDKTRTTRYGNVMALAARSFRCSSISSHPSPMTVTDLNMTRFMMTLDDGGPGALRFENGRSGEIFVQKAPAVTTVAPDPGVENTGG